jgi:acyl-CoA thioesterase FadM
MGAPTVRAELDFITAPEPDQEVVTDLRVTAVGRASASYALTGRDSDGRELYRVKLVACFISRPAFKATPIPEPFRARILSYQKDCGDA